MRKVKFSIRYYKQKNITQQLLMWAQGFGEILDGIVTVFSLGFLCSNFEIEISFWRTRLEIERLKKVHDGQSLPNIGLKSKR